MSAYSRIIIALLVVSILRVFVGDAFHSNVMVYAQETAPHAIGGASVTSLLHEELEIGIYIAIGIALLLCVYLAKSIGDGVLRVTFFGFTIGVILVGLSRVFLFAADRGLYQLEEVNVHIWWHLIFISGILSFIWGGWRLKQNVTLASDKWYTPRDVYVLLAFLTIGILTFIIAPRVEPTMSTFFVGSVIDRLGLHHFLAMGLAAIAGLYILKIKTDWGKMLSVSVTPLLLFLFLMSLQHLWELLTESWKVFALEEAIIEGVEQIILLPAFIILVVGFIQILRILLAQQALVAGSLQVTAIDDTSAKPESKEEI